MPGTVSRLSGFLLVWRHALFTTLRGKRVFGLLFLAGLPLLVAALNIANASNVEHEDFVYTLLLITCQVTVPFGALFLGVAVLGDEVSGRTITFLFTRPLPRSVFYLGRLFGFACAFGAIVAVSVLACTVVYGSRVTITASQVGAALGTTLAGLVAYMAFFAVLRALTQKALYVGFFITFVLEVWLSKVPAGALTRLSLWHHLSLLVARAFEGQIKTRGGPLHNLTEAETVRGSLIVILCVFAVSLAVGTYLVKNREIRVPAAVG